MCENYLEHVTKKEDDKMSKDDWLKKVGQQLAHVCNGKIVAEEPGYTECRMQNGVVKATVASDKTRMLIAQKFRGSKVAQRVSMESTSDEMVVTRSLSGSIEFLHKTGASPEVRIEQKGKRLGDIKVNAYNEKVKTALYGRF